MTKVNMEYVGNKANRCNQWKRNPKEKPKKKITKIKLN